eukprot:g12865.t1
MQVIDDRIEEMTIFAKRLAGDGHLHDAIHILQAVALRLKSPYYVGMRLNNYEALIETSNQLAYQNKSLYAIVEQTDNKFSLSKKIISIHFQVLVTLHSAGDLHNAKIFLIKLYKALIQTSRSKSKRRKMKTLFPPQGLFLMIEILFQYRYFQHILDVHKITKKIYRKELWSTSDDLKRYALMSKEKLNLSNGKQMPPGRYKKLIETSACTPARLDKGGMQPTNKKCGYITSPLAPYARQTVLEEKTFDAEGHDTKWESDYSVLRNIYPKVIFSRNDVDVIEYTNTRATFDLFLNKYVNKGRPVIIRGIFNTFLSLNRGMSCHGNGSKIVAP